MLRDRLVEYYYHGNGHNYSCAEAMLHAINDQYDLKLPQQMFYAASSFSSGCWNDEMCGGLASCIAVLGVLYSEKGHGHDSVLLQQLVSELLSRFRERYGCTHCVELKAKCYIPDRKCEPSLVQICDIFEAIVNKNPIINKTSHMK